MQALLEAYVDLYGLGCIMSAWAQICAQEACQDHNWSTLGTDAARSGIPH
jgi:hypothetical protein